MPDGAELGPAVGQDDHALDRDRLAALAQEPFQVVGPLSCMLGDRPFGPRSAAARPGSRSRRVFAGPASRRRTTTTGTWSSSGRSPTGAGRVAERAARRGRRPERFLRDAAASRSPVQRVVILAHRRSKMGAVRNPTVRVGNVRRLPADPDQRPVRPGAARRQARSRSPAPDPHDHALHDKQRRDKRRRAGPRPPRSLADLSANHQLRLFDSLGRRMEDFTPCRPR